MLNYYHYSLREIILNAFIFLNKDKSGKNKLLELLIENDISNSDMLINKEIETKINTIFLFLEDKLSECRNLKSYY